MFPAAGLGEIQSDPSEPTVAQFAKANRLVTSIVVMVLTGWIQAKEHYGSNMLILLTTYP